MIIVINKFVFGNVGIKIKVYVGFVIKFLILYKGPNCE